MDNPVTGGPSSRHTSAGVRSRLPSNNYQVYAAAPSNNHLPRQSSFLSQHYQKYNQKRSGGGGTNNNVGSQQWRPLGFLSNHSNSNPKNHWQSADNQTRNYDLFNARLKTIEGLLKNRGVNVKEKLPAMSPRHSKSRDFNNEQYLRSVTDLDDSCSVGSRTGSRMKSSTKSDRRLSGLQRSYTETDIDEIKTARNVLHREKSMWEHMQDRIDTLVNTDLSADSGLSSLSSHSLQQTLPDPSEKESRRRNKTAKIAFAILEESNSGQSSTPDKLPKLPPKSAMKKHRHATAIPPLISRTEATSPLSKYPRLPPAPVELNSKVAKVKQQQPNQVTTTATKPPPTTMKPPSPRTTEKTAVVEPQTTIAAISKPRKLRKPSRSRASAAARAAAKALLIARIKAKLVERQRRELCVEHLGKECGDVLFQNWLHELGNKGKHGRKKRGFNRRFHRHDDYFGGNFWFRPVESFRNIFPPFH